MLVVLRTVLCLCTDIYTLHLHSTHINTSLHNYYTNYCTTIAHSLAQLTHLHNSLLVTQLFTLFWTLWLQIIYSVHRLYICMKECWQVGGQIIFVWPPSEWKVHLHKTHNGTMERLLMEQRMEKSSKRDGTTDGSQSEETFLVCFIHHKYFYVQFSIKTTIVYLILIVVKPSVR